VIYSEAMKTLITVFAIFLSSAAIAAESTEREIQFLIDSVGRDGCGFIRNSRRLSTHSARAHLQSKWELNARYVQTAEDFISKLASTSVTSGEPYQIKCRREDAQAAGQWFTERLRQYRDREGAGST